MIEGMHPILMALMQSKHDFQLIGSRYIGVADTNSDWDFMIVHDYKESDEIKALLNDLGFKDQSRGGYCKDSELACHFRWKSDSRQYADVDVVFAYNYVFERRMEAFNIMKELATKDVRKARALMDCLKSNSSGWQSMIKFMDVYRKHLIETEILHEDPK